MKKHLLFVEDEIDLGNVVKQYLEIMDFQVSWFKTAKEALNCYWNKPQLFHLLIIDIQLPDMEGFELAEKILKRNKDQAFLFLTARNEKKDRIKGLKIGADDYINKPFDIDELVLRIKNILKRYELTASNVQNEEGLTVMGDITFHKNMLKLLMPTGDEVDLTAKEAELLGYLSQNQNRVLKREEILITLWGENDYFLGRSLDVFISRLRKVLKASSTVSIENVYGVGFVFRVS
ncbi:response regulator transcription factor [Olivibacter sitiensis]|uniref:response regulator transcription factor n=1 Tax=Olivibacter sitiensis TaxID=376470 RepID=UPI0003F7C53E|nr:response regulator transcription factor [Olivibacter sitiensis]